MIGTSDWLPRPGTLYMVCLQRNQPVAELGLNGWPSQLVSCAGGTIELHRQSCLLRGMPQNVSLLHGVAVPWESKCMVTENL